MNGKMRCGAAKRSITPPAEDLDRILGSEGVRFGRILDELYVRVIAVECGETRVLFVHFDLDKSPNPGPWLRDLTESTGIPEENIFYTTARIHSGPIVSERPEERFNNRENRPPEIREATLRYEALIHERMLEAVEAALNALRPAKMGSFYGESFINEYQPGMEPAVPLDRVLWLVSWVDEEGAPIAFLSNYSMHNALMWMHYRLDKDFRHLNTAYTGTYVMSSDISGFVSRLVEDRFPGTVHLWTCGAAGGDLMSRRDYGDVEIGDVSVPSYASPEALAAEEEPIRNYRTLAVRQFGDLLEILPHIHYGEEAEISAALRVVEIPTFPVEQGADGEIRYEKSIELMESRDKTMDAEAAARRGEPYRIRLHLVRIGKLAFMGVGGMLYSSLGLEMRMAAQKDMLILSDDAPLLYPAGYILDDHAMLHNYKGTRPQRRPGYNGPALVRATQEMFDELLPGE